MIAILYVATLVVFLAVDVVWLKAVAYPLFEKNIGDIMLEEPRLDVAGGFYALYVAGILYFISVPALRDDVRLGSVAIDGAILGALAYGTYEFTNLATIRGWSWTMTAADVTWGAVLTALSATAGVWLVRAVGMNG